LHVAKPIRAGPRRLWREATPIILNGDRQHPVHASQDQGDLVACGMFGRIVLSLFHGMEDVVSDVRRQGHIRQHHRHINFARNPS
jgi:hypothetical protein